MNASIAALAYLAAGVLFILSLRGLSSPETSRRGNTYAPARGASMAGRKVAIKAFLNLEASGACAPREGLGSGGWP